jgi:hypothetical protein
MVTADYKSNALQLLNGELRAFATDLNHAGHPPGYPILLAGIFAVFGDSNTAIQFVQIILDCVAVLLIFLIAVALLNLRIAILAGLLTAFSPQFSNYSLLLLPDSLSVVPLLAAIYCIALAQRRFHPFKFLLAGVFIGLSCWLRANAMLLAPLFALLVLLFFPRGRRAIPAAALVVGAVIVIAPLSIKNYFAYHRFIPISLGAGQKLLEGIAEYDRNGWTGVPKTDLCIMQQEAQTYGRPDYADVLFGVDGVNRDRFRLTRGLFIIRSHPLWYSSVMARRAVSFFRMPRVPIVSSDPPVTHSFGAVQSQTPLQSQTPAETLAQGQVASSSATVSTSPDQQMFELRGDDSKYGRQFVLAPVAVSKQTDYLFRLPVRLKQGRMMITVENDRGQVIAQKIVDPDEGKTAEAQPLNDLSIPWVSSANNQAWLVFSNGGSSTGRTVAEIGRVELFELGPTSYQWTRIPRFLVRNVQRFFITAWMIPLAAFGLALLWLGKQRQTVLILFAVPLYFLLVQSPLHTERRYVMAIHYFLLILAAVTLYVVGRLLRRMMLGSTPLFISRQKT